MMSEETRSRRGERRAGASIFRNRATNPIVSGVIASVVTAVPGLVAVAFSRLLLFPSLAPTAVMQAQHPEHRSSRPYNVIVAHLIGLAAAWASVGAFGLAREPSIFVTRSVSLARVGAVAAAIAIGTAVEVVLRAEHPPAASTTLLAALGSFHPTWHDAANVVGGVLIVALVGELARRARLRLARPDPTREGGPPPD